MRTVVLGKGARCAAALESLVGGGHAVVLAMIESGMPDDPARTAAERFGVEIAGGEPLAMDQRIRAIKAADAELVVLASFSQIVPHDLFAKPSRGALNLHAGKLPQYRGSSPLNWALINGERSFGLSIIRVDAGIDTGPVVAEAEYPIGIDDTIADLHDRANREFGPLLIEAVHHLERDGAPRQQVDDEAVYWPLRFPDDGFIVWDLMTAAQVHNLVRALADPYPNASTGIGDRRVRIGRTRLTDEAIRGEPGRIYRIEGDQLLVAAADRCLWVTEATFFATGEPVASSVDRYDTFMTIRNSLSRGVR